MNNTDLVSGVLQDISRDISENKPCCNIVTFDEYWLKKHHAYDSGFDRISFINDLAMLENSDRVEYYGELSSYKPGLSSVVIFAKRCIRKLMKFLIYPMVEKQNVINAGNTRLGQHMRAFINLQGDNIKTVSELSNKVAAGELSMDAIKKQLLCMNEEIKSLREENDKLKEQIKKVGGES